MESLGDCALFPALLATSFAGAVQAGVAEVNRQRAIDASVAADIHSSAAGAWAQAATDAQVALVGAEARISQLECQLARSERARCELTRIAQALMDENDHLRTTIAH